MSKGSRNRVSNKKTYDENFDKIFKGEDKLDDTKKKDKEARG